MSKYLAIPRTSNVPVVVATSAALKTLIQVATPSTTGITVIAWGVSFAGISGTAVPGICTLTDIDVAATVTSITPEKIDLPGGAQGASLCVGGTSATGFNGTAEGTVGATTRIIDSQQVHPQTGYSCYFPVDSRPAVPASRFLRIRATFAADVNALPWIMWLE